MSKTNETTMTTKKGVHNTPHSRTCACAICNYTRDHQIDNGIVRRPGKFEGQAEYVPYFWDAYLNGLADRDNGTVLGFDVTAEDKERFPGLRKRHTVKLREDSQGFVAEV